MRSSSRPASSRLPDLVLDGALAATSMVVVAAVGAIAVLVVVEAWPVLGDPARLVGTTWRPSEGQYGVAALLLTSLALSAGAVVLAGVVGVVAAVFARELAPAWLGRVIRALARILATLPSVVLGLWGLTAVVPWIARQAPPGASLLAGWVVLGLMLVPTVVVLIDGALLAIPAEQRRAARALALSPAATMQAVVVPALRPAVGHACVLAAARAIGETMAVALVTGNLVQLPSSPLMPVRAMTANIVLEMPYASGDHRAALFATGAVLMLSTSALLVAGGLLWRRSGQPHA